MQLLNMPENKKEAALRNFLASKINKKDDETLKNNHMV